LTDGYRDYTNFCAKYIPKLENYYQEHNRYPQTIEIFDKSLIDFRYAINNCGYQTSEGQYTFYFQEGFGVKGYSSINKKWWID